MSSYSHCSPRSHRLALALLLFAWVAGCAGSKAANGARVHGTSGVTVDENGKPIAWAVPKPGASFAMETSTRVAPGAYVCPPVGPDAKDAAIVLEGVDDVVLDLRGVELRGRARGADPDELTGFGIVLIGCDRVVVKGGRIGGYKVCVAAYDSTEVVLDGMEFDDYYRSRLLSSEIAEDPSDWLYPHDNDSGEWIAKYGAAISLEDCDGVTVKDCRGRHGQNGILLTRSNRCAIFDNDFSFLSGWGLALYRASQNVVCKNVFDYCVRGYSHGVYWRGQDSAGILMFERSCDNLFAANSATHGGDGLFLFGGNDTVLGRAFDRGELDAGGSDRNVWYQNDFSHAVANSIEATFSSDNWAIENVLSGSHQHGVWGGYSRNMVILANEIEDTLGGGVSIEHGQDCVIADNRFVNDDQAIELWWDEDEDLVGGPFGAHRDTDSRAHWILSNEFDGNVQDVVIKKTKGVVFSGNRYSRTQGALYVDRVEKASSSDPAAAAPTVPEVREWMAGIDGSHPSGNLSESSLELHPGGEPQHLKRARAFRPPSLPGKQDARRAHAGDGGLETIVIGEWGPWDFRSGEPRPERRVAGGWLAEATWEATWFSWRDAADPRADREAWRALQFRPLERAEVRAWTDPWGGDAARKKRTADHFGVIASTKVSIADAGAYLLSVVSDDGVRVAIDGRTVIENWTWHAPSRDEAAVELAAGEHTFDLEYFQIDGAAALLVTLEQARTGAP